MVLIRYFFSTGKLYLSLVCSKCGQRPPVNQQLSQTGVTNGQRRLRSNDMRGDMRYPLRCLRSPCCCCCKRANGMSRRRTNSAANPFRQRNYKMSIMSMSLDAFTGFRNPVTEATEQLDLEERGSPGDDSGLCSEPAKIDAESERFDVEVRCEG